MWELHLTRWIATVETEAQYAAPNVGFNVGSIPYQGEARWGDATPVATTADL